MESFKASYGVVLKQGHALMSNLDEEHIDELFAKSSRDIEGSWTTAGLWRSMNNLFESFTRQADKILTFASETRNFVDRFLLARVLEHTRGNSSAAADMLGISRQTMRVKVRGLGISVGHSIELDDDAQS